MRLPVSLLALGVALAGCKSSPDAANLDSVTVSSNPPAAAVRLNGKAVGRTPTTLKLDRTKNYELQVGKGGFITETSELKPRLITTSEGIEYGFPATVKVNLSKVPAAGEATVPPADNPEFKQLAKKALGEEAAAKQELQADIAATQEAAAKIQATLAAREAAANARLTEISQKIAAAKAAKNQDDVAKARLAEAEIALAQAEAEAAAARANAEKSLKTIEARQAALAGVDAKVAAARTNVAQASAPAKVSDDRLVQLEQAYALEVKALKDAQANSNAAIQALNARADELSRRASLTESEAKAAASQSLAEIQKALEDQKAVAAKANEALAQANAELAKANESAKANEAAKAAKAEAAKALEQANDEVKQLQAKLAEANAAAEAKMAEAAKAAEKAVAEERQAAEAKMAEAAKAAEKAVADERLAAEAKLAEANKAAAEAKARAAALKYSEFSSRYALLETKRRTKVITEEEFKAALADLRKELEL